MDGCKLVELEKKLKKEQGTVTRERLEELLGEAIDPGKVAIVVDLVFSALDLPEDGGIEVESLWRDVEAAAVLVVPHVRHGREWDDKSRRDGRDLQRALPCRGII